jgi:hypothetical protein
MFQLAVFDTSLIYTAAFNGIVRLCLAHMSPALHKVAGVPQTTDLQKAVLPNQQSKKWKVVKLDTKTYLIHLLHVRSTSLGNNIFVCKAITYCILSRAKLTLIWNTKS